MNHKKKRVFILVKMVEYFGHATVPKISYSGASLGQIEGKKQINVLNFWLILFIVIIKRFRRSTISQFFRIPR